MNLCPGPTTSALEASTFHQQAYNQPLGSWNVGHVTDMEDTFRGATSMSAGNKLIIHTSFEAQVPAVWGNRWPAPRLSLEGALRDWCANQSAAEAARGPIGTWDVSGVTSLQELLYDTGGACASTFNADIDDWDVGQVTQMASAFYTASAFNGPLESWAVGRVTDMAFMFSLASSFNQVHDSPAPAPRPSPRTLLTAWPPLIPSPAPRGVGRRSCDQHGQHIRPSYRLQSVPREMGRLKGACHGLHVRPGVLVQPAARGLGHCSRHERQLHVLRGALAERLVGNQWSRIDGPPPRPSTASGEARGRSICKLRPSAARVMGSDR